MSATSNTRSLITVAIDRMADNSDSEIKEILHHIPGTHIINTSVLHAHLSDFEWDNSEGPTLPLTIEHVQQLLGDSDGFITVVTAVDKDDYLQAHAGASHEDLIHDRTFAFGLPNDCTAEIIGVQGSDFIVSYTTCIGTQLPGGDNE